MNNTAMKFVMALTGLGVVQRLLILGCVLILVASMGTTGEAQIPVFISDNFSHNEGELLAGTITPVGNRTWSSLVSHEILGGKAAWSDVANSADVLFKAPRDSIFSVEAIASNRDANPNPDYNIGLGFADDLGPPGQNISGRSSLTLAISRAGNVSLWDNSFNTLVASGKTLTDVGLPLFEMGNIPMLLEIDPVNNRARAEVNNVEVYDIAYTIINEITWAGFGWAGQSSGAWDDFVVRALSEATGPPTSFLWINDRSSAWNATSGGNWREGAPPNSNEHSVIFSNLISQPRAVFVDEDVTARSLQINSPNGYAIVGPGTVNLESGGAFEGQDAEIRVLQPATQGSHQFQAVVNLQDDTTADVATGATLVFNNAVNLNGFTLTVTGGGTLTFNNQVNSDGGMLGLLSGVLGGAGAVSGIVNNSGGTLSPGNSPGVFEIGGNYMQGADGSLLVELGGTAAGVDHDVLKVGGDIDLAGQFEVILIDGFQPAVGDSFDILDFSSVTGAFDHVSLPPLPDGLAWDDSALYTAGSLTVVPEPGTLLLLATGLLGLVGFGRHRGTSTILTSTRAGVLMFGYVLAFLAGLSMPAAAQPVVIADNFNRPDGPLNGSVAPIHPLDSNGTWDATYSIVDNRISGVGPTHHAFQQFEAPTNSVFSVEGTTFRDISGPTQVSVGLGFADTVSGEPSGLALTLDIYGNIGLYDNSLANFIIVARQLPFVGLDSREQGPTDMLLPLDPVANRARAQVNGVLVYNIPYVISEPITGAGMFTAGSPSATWDEFAVRVGPAPVGPTSFEWKHDHSGNWNTRSHWDPVGTPNGNSHTVIFGDENLGPLAVVTETAVSAKVIQFDSANAYAIGGLGSVNLDSDAGNASVSVLEGNHQFQTVVNLADNTTVNVAASMSLAFNNALNLSGRTLSKTGAGTLNINNLQNSGGGSVVVTGGLLGGSGEVGGNLTNSSGGSVGPGQSAGTLSVEGNYTQQAGSVLKIELGGTEEGVEHDVLDVGGVLAINGGTLQVLLIDGFTPTNGNQFDILDFASSSGAGFSSFLLPPGDWDTSQLLVNGLLTFGAVLTGDLDCDGDVDFDDIDDFVLGLNNPAGYEAIFGVPPSLKGDTDGDDDLDFDDISGFVSILQGGALQAVPEPTTFVLAFIGLIYFACYGRRPRM